MNASDHTRPTLQLALQGGGAHGAFTWGVLDCLLDQDDIRIGDVTGSSAGALNGAALVTGLRRGGRQAAKDNLARLWQCVAQVGAPMTWLMLPLQKPWLGVWDDAVPLLSPYQTNPFALEPLRFIVSDVVDLDLLKAPGAQQLFVNAIHVHSGRTRVFDRTDLTIDAIVASACAPLVYQAADIEGEPYWDGSYGANPSLWPLYEASLDVDLLLVELAPLQRAETPTTAKNILNRINEIASVNGLVGELQALDMVNCKVPGADIRMHVISLPDEGANPEIEPSVKRAVGIGLFESLRQSGYRACESWLQMHGPSVGVASTVDIGARYLADRAGSGRHRPGACASEHKTHLRGPTR